jgi:formylglycine-generating enzyme required for sulfatase activity
MRFWRSVLFATPLVVWAVVTSCTGDDPALVAPGAQDAATPDAPTTDAPDDRNAAVDAAVCEAGARDCAGQTPRACQGGVWQEQNACTGDTPICAGGDCITPPSCAAMVATGTRCGASADSCCASPIVTGGTFSRSYDKVVGGGYEDAGAIATLSDFRLDRYEVTVGRFRAFFDTARGTQGKPPAKGEGASVHLTNSGWDEAWNTQLPPTSNDLDSSLKTGGCANANASWTTNAGTNEKRPITCVSWYEAFAFCAWDGARLPTEAEWNYAAAGGNEQRQYPWGLGIDATRAAYDCLGDSVVGCASDISDLLPVGSRAPAGDGKFGQSDLAGNVDEWVLDWYTADYPLPCKDCATLTGVNYRTLRGGAFNAAASSQVSSFRMNGQPINQFWGNGFRCARNVP